MAAEVVALLSRRLDEVGIQPFHELISDRNILEARLWEVKDGKQGKAGIQFAVVLGIELERFWTGDIAL